MMVMMMMNKKKIVHDKIYKFLLIKGKPQKRKEYTCNIEELKKERLS